ncbi:probable RNA-binding protein EIF1AD [Denticeps clupeoides]|uniref:Probable RNA-binding protein EIF1AD n=1 Tax=Denticeps clupeoides TaxID=299321 RepID=A0AAY4BM96_9TELE|nr:probable RNA-binding protein EIF1AD [Denticeps clupeoides]XP_028824119.1 probable RNA-binding protein EIF1AD [Denticeps clupeoides]
MSQATKRKHVVKEVLCDFIRPTEKQQVVKVVGSPGNNLHEVVTAGGEQFLVSMPTKFRKNIWIKRGHFVIMDPIEEGDKVRGEISSILYREHIHHLQKLGVWPDGFNQQKEDDRRRGRTEAKEQGEEEEEGDDSDLFVNTNRTNCHYSESEEDSDDDEEEEEEPDE